MIDGFKRLSTGSKIATVFGTLVGLFGLVCAAGYFSSMNDCNDLNSEGIMTLGISQLATVGLVAILVATLAKPHGTPFKITVAVSLVIIAFAQLVVVTGWGFAVGTVCSN